MDGRRVGRVVRAVRRELGLRQSDVAAKARVSQAVVSLIERGEQVSFRSLAAVASALDITLRIEAWWRGGQLDRLLDRDHAALVEYVAAILRRYGWIIRLEYEFNHFGDRGSVDLLAWHPAEKVLLIIEVKSALTDLQATLMSYARKLRIVPELVASREGWDVRRVGRLLVVSGTRANRSVVAQHPSIFQASFPQRGHEVRQWIRRPEGHLGGLWFVAPNSLPVGNQRSRATMRVRRSNPSVARRVQKP